MFDEEEKRFLAECVYFCAANGMDDGWGKSFVSDVMRKLGMTAEDMKRLNQIDHRIALYE